MNGLDDSACSGSLPQWLSKSSKSASEEHSEQFSSPRQGGSVPRLTGPSRKACERAWKWAQLLTSVHSSFQALTMSPIRVFSECTRNAVQYERAQKHRSSARPHFPRNGRSSPLFRSQVVGEAVVLNRSFVRRSISVAPGAPVFVGFFRDFWIGDDSGNLLKPVLRASQAGYLPLQCRDLCLKST